jgi:hypothetical protein
VRPRNPQRGRAFVYGLPLFSPIAHAQVTAATKPIQGGKVKNKHFCTAALFVLIAFGPASAFAQPARDGRAFVPFNSFLEKTRGASIVDFAGLDVRVKDEPSFEEMRQHILSLYSGVEIRHSFVMNTSHFDCIPIEQQPGVKALAGRKIAEAPPQSVLPKPAAGNGEADRAIPSTQFTEKQADEFGNAVGCEAGEIPMRRVTLEELTRFPTIEDFFEKGPNGAGRPTVVNPNEVAPQSPTQGHKYSITYQYVNNLGGNSNLNLWNPYVNTNWGEVFSLSQQWYVGGSENSTQTAEVGWQNYPGKYGNEEARLFIYWTADYYNHTGCYNLDCGAFVQTSNKAALGADSATTAPTGARNMKSPSCSICTRATGGWRSKATGSATIRAASIAVDNWRTMLPRSNMGPRAWVRTCGPAKAVGIRLRRDSDMLPTSATCTISTCRTAESRPA